METAQNSTRIHARTTGDAGQTARGLTDGERDALQHTLHREPLQSTWAAMERIPVGAYYFAMLGSVATAFTLFVAGKKESAQFVGQWAPTFALLGLMNKLLKPTRS
jgi:hypothetical protein